MLESGKAFVKITPERKGHNVPDEIKTYTEKKAKIIPEENKTRSEEKIKIVPEPKKPARAEEAAHESAPEKEAVSVDDEAAVSVSLTVETPKIAPPVSKRESKKYS